MKYNETEREILKIIKAYLDNMDKSVRSKISLGHSNRYQFYKKDNVWQGRVYGKLAISSDCLLKVSKYIFNEMAKLYRDKTLIELINELEHINQLQDNTSYVHPYKNYKWIVETNRRFPYFSKEFIKEYNFNISLYDKRRLNELPDLLDKIDTYAINNGMKSLNDEKGYHYNLSYQDDTFTIGKTFKDEVWVEEGSKEDLVIPAKNVVFNRPMVIEEKLSNEEIEYLKMLDEERIKRTYQENAELADYNQKQFVKSLYSRHKNRY